jgi:molybdopterin-binding protein
LLGCAVIKQRNVLKPQVGEIVIGVLLDFSDKQLAGLRV